MSAPPLPAHPLFSTFEALARGAHSDPFSVLGPHADGAGVVIRTIRPHAADVCVLDTAGRVHPMTRLHGGVFEIRIEGMAARDPYRLRVTHEDGSVAELDDPYRFGRVMGELDLHLFAEGTLRRAFDVFGARATTIGDVAGPYFAVWAPNASRVSVVGDFNAWDGRVHVMRRLVPSGVWELFVPGIGPGTTYKYEVRSSYGVTVLKADPFARYAEVPPATASVVWDAPAYDWRDREWLDARAAAGSLLSGPSPIYEVHLGSWMRAEDGETFR